MSEVHAKIDQILSETPVVLFMKGTAQFPMCGFSARAAAILQDIGVDFKGINVLEEHRIS